MNNLILFVKGFIFGTANIIPGVSGGTIAMILGVYEKLLNVFGYFLKDLKENIKFLLPFLGGTLISVFAMSNIISYSLSNYNMVTLTFFIGLILGGIPMIYNKVKKDKTPSNLIYFFAGFSIVLLLSMINVKSGNYNDLTTTSFITLFFVGILSSSAMVIPGISGSFILILLGYYESIINVIKDILDFNDLIFNFIFLFFFGLGIITGIVVISRFIKYLIEKYEVKTYYTVLGFILASIITVFSNVVFNSSFLILSIIALLTGITIAYKLGE